MRRLLVVGYSLLIMASLFGFARIAWAQATGGSLVNPLSCNDFGACATKITGLLLIIAAPIATIMVLYGGFQMMTAGGEPEKFSQGRKTLLYAAIGFVVVLLANQVVNIIKAIFK